MDSFWESRGGWGRYGVGLESSGVGEAWQWGSQLGQPAPVRSRWCLQCPCRSWHFDSGNPLTLHHISNPETPECSNYFIWVCYVLQGAKRCRIHICAMHTGTGAWTQRLWGALKSVGTLGGAWGCHALGPWQKTAIWTCSWGAGRSPAHIFGFILPALLLCHSFQFPPLSAELTFDSTLFLFEIWISELLASAMWSQL